MIVVYNRKKGTFTAFKDAKMASKACKIDIKALRGLRKGVTFENEGFIVGKIEIIKSNRGGFREKSQDNFRK